MKLGTVVLIVVGLLALGSVLAPFAALAYFISCFTLSEIIKGAIILYVLLIPVSVFAQPR